MTIWLQVVLVGGLAVCGCGALAMVAAMRSSQVSRLLELQSPAYRDLLAPEAPAPPQELRRSA